MKYMKYMNENTPSILTSYFPKVILFERIKPILKIVYVKALAPLIFSKILLKYPSKTRISFTRINLFLISNVHIFKHLMRTGHKII